MELVKAQLEALRCSEGDIDVNDLPDEWKLIESGDWQIDFKDYANMEAIIQHVESGTFWSINRNRTGSYYREYFYSESYFTQVHQVEKTVLVWEAING